MPAIVALLTILASPLPEETKAPPAPAGAPRVARIEPAQSERGALIRVTVAAVPAAQKVSLRIDRGAPIPTQPGSARGKLDFMVPRDLTPGDHEVELSRLADGVDVPIPFEAGVSSRLRVPVPKDTPKIAAASPLFLPSARAGYSITLTGDGFSTLAADNLLILDGVEQKICWPLTGAKCSDNLPTGSLRAGGHELALEGLRMEPGRQHKIQVAIGDGPRSNEVSVGLASISPEIARGTAFAVLAALALLIVALGWTGLRSPGAFLLEEDKQSYSLSKAQFYLWTAALTFGYAYLALVQVLIQGSRSFPTIPESLTKIFAITAGTTTLATGIASAKGRKGAGSTRPALSDLLTVGGLVAAERVQLVVWTALGIGTFLLLLLAYDPLTLPALPEVPNTLLALMGVSSAGYLGGKVARKPGPIVDSVVPRAGSLVLEINGQKLSPDATISLNGLPIVDKLLREKHPQSRAEVALSDEKDAEFARQLRFFISTADKAWLEKLESRRRTQGASSLVLLSLTNPDGQRADREFELPAALLSAATNSPGPEVVRPG